MNLNLNFVLFNDTWSHEGYAMSFMTILSSFIAIPRVFIRYGSAGPCADGVSLKRTCDMKNSQYSECFSNFFFSIMISLTDQ